MRHQNNLCDCGKPARKPNMHDPECEDCRAKQKLNEGLFNHHHNQKRKDAMADKIRAEIERIKSSWKYSDDFTILSE